MELTIKHFDELSAQELFEIYRSRVAVFVVEQNCPYQEVDEADRHAYHITLREDNELVAYLRVVEQNVLREEVTIGRVLSLKRRKGYASRLLSEGIRVAEECLDADKIVIEAQVYAMPLYEKAGFVPVSEEFLEDGIPHVRMLRTKA
ncbi:MAG: GNAT family N-acetyltransferase [Oscillospiraceae bacterium]|nr:GNAT family N-acetyltransferase [Oscillospiraceae bacterium]